MYKWDGKFAERKSCISENGIDKLKQSFTPRKAAWRNSREFWKKSIPCSTIYSRRRRTEAGEGDYYDR